MTVTEPIPVQLRTTRSDLFLWLARVAKALPDVDVDMGAFWLTEFSARPRPGSDTVIEIHGLDYSWDPTFSGVWKRGGGLDGLGSSIPIFRLEVDSEANVEGKGWVVEGLISCPVNGGSNAETVHIVQAVVEVYQALIRLLVRKWPNCGLTLDGTERKQRGRPKFAANKWACSQIRKGVPRTEVRKAWEERYIKEKGADQFSMLADPDKSFDEAVAAVTRK